jgi:hypothetical protein
MNRNGLRARMRTLTRKGVVLLAAAGALIAAAALSGGTAAASTSAAAHHASTAAAETRYGTSPNWAGYVIQSGWSDKDVTGEWTVPSVSCPLFQNSQVAMWDGIGGWGKGNPLLQTGITEACNDGNPEYFAWWEMFPANPDNFANLTVSPGDRMQASVYLDSAGQWITRIDNVTTGWSGWAIVGSQWGIEQDGTSYFRYQGSASNISFSGGDTVEWVVERPSSSESGQSYQPVVDFGSVRFYDLRTALSSWGLSSSEALTMKNGNQTLAQPGLAFADGFSVWYM